MAEPKTEVDRRFDRLELAISTLAYMVVTDDEAERIEKILQLEKEVEVDKGE